MVDPSRSEIGLWSQLKQKVKDAPFIGWWAQRLYFAVHSRRFTDSSSYWEQRYRSGRGSGTGSYGRLALFKAEILNAFVRENGVERVIEFGCGDGAQLSLADYPHYHGVDVSPHAVQLCRDRFRNDITKTFDIAGSGKVDTYDLALSLDVVFHLVEDDVFDAYMQSLFAASRRFVIIYSSNVELPTPEPHVRHRRFTTWIKSRRPLWILREVIPNRYPYDARETDQTSNAEFYIFEKRESDQ